MRALFAKSLKHFNCFIVNTLLQFFLSEKLYISLDHLKKRNGTFSTMCYMVNRLVLLTMNTMTLQHFTFIHTFTASQGVCITVLCKGHFVYLAILYHKPYFFQPCLYSTGFRNYRNFPLCI